MSSNTTYIGVVTAIMADSFFGRYFCIVLWTLVYLLVSAVARTALGGGGGGGGSPCRHRST